MDNEIVLYSYALSPYAGKVHAFLNFKKLPFRVHYVNPLRAAKELDFTGQHFVPVVRIGKEWRADSTPIGLWLDEVFPESPLLPQGDTERTSILAIDRWVSDSLIAGNFRTLIQSGSVHRKFNFRRAAKILDLTVANGFPRPLQWLWPWLAPHAPFIKKLVASLDQSESVMKMQQRHCTELVDYLGQGDFLGGMSSPSLADLAAYQQVVNHYRAGYLGMDAFLEYPRIVQWAKRVEHCAEGDIPTLPDVCVVNHDI